MCLTTSSLTLFPLPLLSPLVLFPGLTSLFSFSKMKKLSQFKSIMDFCNHFRSSLNLLSLSAYSTSAVRPRKPLMGSLNSLYRKISPVGDPKASIVPVLDQWIADGRDVNKTALIAIIKELRHYGRYKHALEVPIFFFFFVLFCSFV